MDIIDTMYEHKKIFKLIATLLLYIFFFIGCGSGTGTNTGQSAENITASTQNSTASQDTTANITEAKKEETPDTFIYAIDEDPVMNSVNVITTCDRYGLMAIKLLYSPLYMFNNADDIVYFLAESVKQSSDFLSIDIKLRKNVKWTDGKLFTADDVVFTYDKMLTEEGAWAKTQLIFSRKPIKVEKVDDYNVKFTFPQVTMNAMESIANVFIMPKHVYEGEANIESSPKNASPVGTGPYKLSNYKSGEYTKFVKNDNYFLGAPKIPNVIFRQVGDSNTAILALQNGEINAYAIQPADAHNFKGGNVSIIPYSENRIGYMAFNLGSETIKSKEVRQAILYAINKQEIITGSYISNEYSDEAISFLPRKATYYTENVPAYKYDVERAKELVASSGADKLKIRLAYITNNAIYEKQAAIIQQNLKAVGINLELIVMDLQAFMVKQKEGNSDYEMYLSGYIMGIDPDTFASLFLTDGLANYMRYSNLEVDNLFEQGRIETDIQKRKEIYEKIQRLIIKDGVFFPLTENKMVLAIDSRIGGIEEASLVPVYTFEDMSKLFFK